MKEKSSKRKIKIVYIIVIVLIVISVVELILLLNTNKKELQNKPKESKVNKITKEPNYDDEITLGDILFNSINVQYNNSNSGLTSTNVKTAIDEVYQKILNNAVAIDPDTFETCSAKTIYASSEGVCIRRNNKLNCFKKNNYNYEKTHLQQVFSNITCTEYSTYVDCTDSEFICRVYDNGWLGCIELASNTTCNVYDDGSVHCN